MNKLITTGQTLSRWTAWVGGGVLLATAVLITVEVVLRKVFSISMGGSDEISSYVMAISCSFGFAFALFEKAHIRIDVLYNKFPAGFQHILDLVSLIFLGIYMSVLSFFGFKVFWVSFTKGTTANTPLHTPLWIPQLLWNAGLWVFTLAIILLLTGTLAKLIKGDRRGAQLLSGASRLKDEIEKDTVVLDETVIPGGGK